MVFEQKFMIPGEIRKAINLSFSSINVTSLTRLPIVGEVDLRFFEPFPIAILITKGNLSKLTTIDKSTRIQQCEQHDRAEDFHFTAKKTIEIKDL
jgi:hypothetical protein